MNKIKCKECKNLMFSDCYGECKKGYITGIVKPDFSCGKGVKKDSKDLIFIKKFSKISVSKICKELNINTSNLFSNRTTENNITLVKTEIIKKVLTLLNDSYNMESDVNGE